MARFPDNNHDQKIFDAQASLEQPRISIGTVIIGSVGVLNCASVIVTLLMAG